MRFGRKNQAEVVGRLEVWPNSDNCARPHMGTSNLSVSLLPAPRLGYSFSYTL